MLALVFQKRGLTQELKKCTLLFAFAKACGAWLSEHVRAERVYRDTLYVRVEDAAWNQHVFMLKDKILKRIQEIPEGKEIRDIRCKVGPLDALPRWEWDQTDET